MTAGPGDRVLMNPTDRIPAVGSDQGWALAYGPNGECLWQEGGTPGVHLGGSVGSWLDGLAPTPDGGAWASVSFVDGIFYGPRMLARLEPDGTPASAAPTPLPLALGLGVELLALPSGGGLLSSTLWRHDSESGTWTSDPWVCPFDNGGALRWGTPEAPGVRIPLAAGSFYDPVGVTAGVNGATWTIGIETRADRSTAWRVTAFAGDGLVLRSDVRTAIYGPREAMVASLVPTQDGGYILGYTDHESPDAPRSAWIGRYDAEGRSLWPAGGETGRRFRTAGGDTCITGLAATPDGRIVAAGWSASSGVLRAWIQCLDMAGRSAWGFDGLPEVVGAGPASFASVSFAPVLDGEGNAFLAGVVRPSAAEAGELWVLKLDPSGRSLWNRGFNLGLRIGSDGQEAPLGLLPTADGGCLVLGRSDWGTSLDGGIWWLSRIDARGNVDFSGVRQAHTSDVSRAAEAFMERPEADPLVLKHLRDGKLALRTPPR